MEESTKRRERLKAMREEASQTAMRNNNDDSGGTSNLHRLSNPFIETPGSDPVHASPRFDFYTHPISAFSGHSSSSKVSPQTPKDHFTPPSVPPPQLQLQVNYSSNRQTLQTQGPAYFPSSNYPRGLNFQSPNYSPGQGRGPWFNPNPNSGPSVGPGFQHGGNSPNFNHGQVRGQWSGNNPAPGGNPSFNSGQGRSYWQNINNPGPNFDPGLGREHYPGFGQGSRPNFHPGQGRGYRFNSPGNVGPSSGRGNWVSSPGQGRSGRSGGRGRGGHNNMSAEQRPDLYYNRSMMEDPWKSLEPIVWRRENISSLNIQRNSWIPESIRGKKVKVMESLGDSGSKQSLAEYLAASFNEAVKEEQPQG